MDEDKLLCIARRFPSLFPLGLPPILSSVPRGWASLVQSLCHEIEQLVGRWNGSDVTVLQVKEKVGSLRVRVNVRLTTHARAAKRSSVARRIAESELEREIAPLVVRAEAMSRLSCIICGDQGELRVRRGHLAPLCEEHAGHENQP